MILWKYNVPSQQGAERKSSASEVEKNAGETQRITNPYMGWLHSYIHRGQEGASGKVTLHRNRAADAIDVCTSPH